MPYSIKYVTSLSLSRFFIIFSLFHLVVHNSSLYLFEVFSPLLHPTPGAQHIFLSQLQTLEEDCKVQLGLVLCDMGTELLRARDGLGSLAYFSQSLEWNTSGSTLLLRAGLLLFLFYFLKLICS